MVQDRVIDHPILGPRKLELVDFTWNGERMQGASGEMISSALIANGVHVFGHHYKDGSPQGIFCANGQCSQCMVIVDGRPLKACMTPLSKGMAIRSVEGLPEIPMDLAPPRGGSIPVTEVEVLIIGGGPAGLSAAIELGKLGADVLLIDDKDRLGGKLVLQTHKFFGSVSDSYAGTRGYEIGHILERRIGELKTVKVWLETTAIGVFSDGIVGAIRKDAYKLIRPRQLLVATGARERMLSFPGNTLPGIYGAGAFQTLVNRDLIKPSGRVLIVGGGNVGLIAGYHAVQAGIGVVALVEALPQVGGYKVHADKLMRLGVPILTGHTIVAAHGTDRVESVTIARLDERWKVVPGTERTYSVDTVLIAVGLSEVNEFHNKAREWGIPVRSAGDAQEIAEASAAMFTGRIEGMKIAKDLGLFSGEVPKEWDEKAAILKSKPGPITRREHPSKETGVFPIFHCVQEVPCNPCTSVCPVGAIRTEKDMITGLPYMPDIDKCIGCLSCAAICPGLAATILDYRKDPDNPTVTLPYEIWRKEVEAGTMVPVTDEDGAMLGRFPVQKVVANPKYPGTFLVQVKLPKKVAKGAVGIWVQEEDRDPSEQFEKGPLPDEAIICRCERVSAGEIRAAIRSGVTDMNQLKALTRAGMGACGSKTCRSMIQRIFREEGIDLAKVTDRTDRPLFVEVTMGSLAGEGKG